MTMLEELASMLERSRVVSIEAILHLISTVYANQADRIVSMTHCIFRILRRHCLLEYPFKE